MGVACIVVFHYYTELVNEMHSWLSNSSQTHSHLLRFMVCEEMKYFNLVFLQNIFINF